ncbi:ABC transporter permease [Lachnospiraceae bacterium LCP25S3_G4]
MRRFFKMYTIEQKLGFRSCDGIIFGICMPVGVLFLIAVIAGGRSAGDGGYTYLESAYASLIAVGICACAFMGIPLTIADYRDKRILKHFFVTPCSPRWILGAVMACNIVIAMLSAIAVTAVAVLLLGYHMTGSTLAFVGAWVLTLISMFSIGLLLASLCKTVKTANAVTSAVYFPMLFLSGATIPYELFPTGLQKVASILPLTQGIKLMKAISIGAQIEHVVGIVILLLAITVICSIISVNAFRWE